MCIDDDDDSSSPTMSSCGLEAVGVVEGESFRDEGKLAPAELAEKLRNIARIESALAGFCLPIEFLFCLLVINRSEMLELRALGIAKSELVNESLPKNEFRNILFFG